MTKYMFKCPTCFTIMTIETELKENSIHMAPPCPCGKSRMLNMASNDYAYGEFKPEVRKANAWE